MNSFTSTVADLLPGPDWQVEARRHALQAADGLAVPSPDEEAWRYSRIGELQLDNYHPQGAPSDRENAAPVDLAQYPDPAATLTVRNGWIDQSWVSHL